MADSLLLEDASGRLLLEDGSGGLALENAAVGGGVPFTESFTGADGSAPAHLILGFNPTSGGGATIQSNRLDLASGTAAGSYNAANRVSRALSADSSSGLSIADVGAMFTLQVSGPETYFAVGLRSVQLTGYDGQTSYEFTFSHGNSVVSIAKNVNYTNTSLASQAFTFSTSTVYYCRVDVVGSALRLFIGTGSLPATPTLTATDSAITAAGYGILGVTQDGAAASNHAYIDDMTVDAGTFVAASTVVRRPIVNRAAVQRAASW